MRYFLTKLTFNNHFYWLYVGNRKFRYFFLKKLGGFKIKSSWKHIINRYIVSLVWRLKLYISGAHVKAFDNVSGFRGSG